MPTVHFIYGRVGAGKTTYGRTFAADHRAVFFCLDEWMATLYMMDAPQPLTLEWALPRTQRCEAQIRAVAGQLLACGVDVVLELGFFTREQRKRVRDWAATTAAAVSLHLLEVPRDVRLERVRARNRGSATLTVTVDDTTFEWAESYYEDVGDDELEGARVVRGIGGDGPSPR